MSTAFRVERKRCFWDATTKRFEIEASTAGLAPGLVPTRVELGYLGAVAGDHDAQVDGAGRQPRGHRLDLSGGRGSGGAAAHHQRLTA